MIIIGIIILVVVPPEKLPEVMRKVASFLNDFRRQTTGVWDELKRDAAFKTDDIFKPTDYTAEKILEEQTQLASPNPNEDTVATAINNNDADAVASSAESETQDDNKPNKA